MKTINRKITTEEFKDGQLIKRTIEETTEEIKDSKLEPIILPKVGDNTPPWERKWFSTSDSNIALLNSDK